MTGSKRTEDEQVAALTAAHPDWFIHYLPEAQLPWEARRLPFRLPESGGYMWLNAPNPERLADLIGGALQLEAQLATEDAARARLEALKMRAAGAGLRAELEHDVLTLTAPATDDGPGRSEKVTCLPRLEDGGALWFFDSRGKQIVDADNVVDAVVLLGGALARNGPAPLTP